MEDSFQKKASDTAEKVIAVAQFWKDDNRLSHRKLRILLRANFISAKNIFIAFFGEIRSSSSSDYIDEHTKIISKQLKTIDPDVVRNAIKNIAEYGFRLGVHYIGGDYNCYRIYLTPFDIVTNYMNDCFLYDRKDVDAGNVLRQLKMTCRYFD